MRVRPLDHELEWRRAEDFAWGRANAINPFVCHFGGGTKNVTSTSTSQPWTVQQPYLTTGFSAANNLLNRPAPQQLNPVAGFNPEEWSAINGITGLASAGSSIVPAATNFATMLENGGFLNANPANGYFSRLAGTNLGNSGPGADVLSSLMGSNPGVDNAGTASLTKFANGGYFSNGYNDDVAQSVMSSVVPQIAAQFNGGNSNNNPLLARAASQGATSALAPLEYQNYQTQEQLAQNAASTLASNKIAGAQAQGTFAQMLQQLGLSGGGLQATAAEGLSQPWQQTLTSMVQGNALAPQNQALNYADLDKLFNIGATEQQQTQNELSGAAQSYNFSQLSPYQQLQAYMNAISGNYGNTGTQTTPYFTNQGANGLSGALGGLGIASAFPETMGALGGALGLSGGAAGAGLGALLAFL